MIISASRRTDIPAFYADWFMKRKSCNCVKSADMGIYNTCHFRCTYCYANFNEGIIEGNCRKHHPDSPSLLYKFDGDG